LCYQKKKKKIEILELEEKIKKENGKTKGKISERKRMNRNLFSIAILNA